MQEFQGIHIASEYSSNNDAPLFRSIENDYNKQSHVDGVYKSIHHNEENRSDDTSFFFLLCHTSSSPKLTVARNKIFFPIENYLPPFLILLVNMD